MLYNNSASTLHHFDSVKWKRRFFNLSHKLHRTNNSHWNAASSATAMAAATEKYIRHTKITPTGTSEIVIHSEDLTASQFANLTGIKTKRNPVYYSSSAAGDMYVEDEDSDEDEDDEDSRDFYTASVSSYKQNNQPVMKIWDSHFWQDNNQRKSLPSIPLTTSSSMKEIASEKIELCSQPLSRHISEPGGARVPSMIQKGRFKIVWGGDDNEPIVRPESHCVEWKRKRASSNSSATTTAI